MKQRPYIYIVREGQGPKDVALTNYGSVQGLTLLQGDNPDLNLEECFATGQELRIASNAIDDSNVEYFEERGYHIGAAQPGDSQNLEFDFTLEQPIS